MQKKDKRIVIDTNLWISFLITKDLTKLDEIIFSRNYILIFSQELLDEFLEVVRRPKFRRFFSPSDVEDLLKTIHECALFIKVHTHVDACRDAKDNFLLSLSVDGNSDFLLIGDSDLLSLKKFGTTTITTITDFLQKH